MGMIESGVNKAVHFTVRHGRWVGPLALTGCLIGGAILNALPADTFVSNPTPIPTPGQTGVGGGGGELFSTATAQPTNGPEICVEVGSMPLDRQTAWSAAEKLALSTGRNVESPDTVTIRHRLGDWGTTTFEKIRKSDYISVVRADRLCAEGKR